MSTAPASGGLVGVLRRGAAISACVLVLVQALSLAQTLLLARLLTPQEVGVFAAGTAVTVLLLGVSEGGIRSALVQRADDGLEVAANTALWASLAGGLGAGLLGLALAPALGAFVGDPLAGTICAACAGVPVLQALTAVPDALLQRRFAFRRRLVTDPAVALGFIVPAVVLAALGAGPWSMVVGLYASNLAFVVSTWLLARWRPGRARPSWWCWRQMAAFSWPLVLGGIGERTRTLLEAALVGRWLGTAPLAFYRYGRRVAELPIRMVVEVGDYVLFPAFARIADDRERLRAGFLRALGLVWLATIPVAGVLVALGTPLVVVLLGEPWRGAGVVLETMAGWGPGQAMFGLVAGVLKGAGRTRPIHLLTTSGLVLGIGLLVVLVTWLGLAGVGLAVSAERLATGVLALALVRTTAGVTGRGLAGDLLPAVLAGSVATIPVALLERQVVHSDRFAAPVALGLLTLEALTIITIHLGVLRVVAPSALGELRTGVRGLRAHGTALRSRWAGRPRPTSGAGRIVWVSTSRRTRGGIATYVDVVAGTSLFADGRIHHLASHVDGSAARKLATYARAQAALVWLLLRRRVDLVHLHTASRGSFARKAAMMWTATAGGVATVLHVHGGGFADWHDAGSRPLRTVVRSTLRRADVVVVLSDVARDRLSSIAPGARLVVVPNPVAVREERRGGPIAAGPRPVRVVCPGRISPAKGTPDLLEAWARLASPLGRAHLVLVGDGDPDEIERACRRAAAPDLAGRVEIGGWVPHERVLELLADADVLVLPSRVEGLPMVVLEAMAAGLPVVACAVGGVPELVEDGVTGVLVAPDDVLALRDALAGLLADADARAAMGAAGRERVHARHVPEAISATLDALYGELLSGRGRRGRSRA